MNKENLTAEIIRKKVEAHLAKQYAAEKIEREKRERIRKESNQKIIDTIYEEILDTIIKDECTELDVKVKKFDSDYPYSDFSDSTSDEGYITRLLEDMLHEKELFQGLLFNIFRMDKPNSIHYIISWHTKL